MRIGDRVTMTAYGKRMAETRQQPVRAGEVRDEFGRGRNRQLYVRVANGRSLWWPAKAWTPTGTP